MHINNDLPVRHHKLKLIQICYQNENLFFFNECHCIDDITLILFKMRFAVMINTIGG